MSRSLEFFHGSNHAFSEGDVVTPDYDLAQEGEVHATNDQKWASTFGDHLYQVHPVTSAKKVNEDGDVEHWVSHDGYRVSKVLY